MSQTLFSVTTATTSTYTSSTLDFKNAESYTLFLSSGTGTGTSPTLDWVVQTSFDDGTTWLNLPLRSAQITTGATVTTLIFRNGLGDNEVAVNQIVAATGGTLAKNCNFVPAKMRIVGTIGGTNPSYATLAAYLFTMPLGTQR
jgi:hypothetical protein